MVSQAVISAPSAAAGADLKGIARRKREGATRGTYAGQKGSAA